MADKHEENWVLLQNDSKRIKQIKTLLEANGHYDRTRIITKTTDGEYAIPVKPEFLVFETRRSTLPSTESTSNMTIAMETVHLPAPLEDCKLCKLPNDKTTKKKPTNNTKAQKIETIVNERAAQQGIIDRELMNDFLINVCVALTKIYRHGNLVVLPKAPFTHPFWEILSSKDDKIWSFIAEVLCCSRIALQGSVLPDQFRSPDVMLVLGDNEWVEHIDNGVKYIFDVTQCMFSRGNITEKLRMAQLSCDGETIVDLYAGIGYFTLPLLVHTGVKCVHACEWNPAAVQGLKRGLIANGVNDRCVVHQGDNREVAPKNIADRVLLGLIPSSEEGWPVACSCLRSDKGGWLHVHGNVDSNLTNDTNELLTEVSLSSISDYNIEESLSTSTYQFPLSGATPISDDTPIKDSFEGNTCYENPHIVNLITKTEDCLNGPELSTTTKHKTSIGFPTYILPEIQSSKQAIWLSWAKDVSSKILLLLETHNPCEKCEQQCWIVTVQHVEHVKSYAPHVDHVVVDLECRRQH